MGSYRNLYLLEDGQPFTTGRIGGCGVEVAPKQDSGGWKVLTREREIRLAGERWRRKLARKGKRRDPLPDRKEVGLASHDRYRSVILSQYQQFKPFNQRLEVEPRTFKLPKVFSITENPIETLKMYREIVEFARSTRTPRVVVDHRPVKVMGLAADSVLAVLLKEMSLENRERQRARIRGFKANDTAVRKMMDEIGCVRVMHTGISEDIRLELGSGAKVFRHQNRKNLQVDPLTLDPLSAVAVEFADHLNICLASAGKKLTDSGRQQLLGYVGEIMANAQEHSSLAEWTIAGYLDQDNATLTYRCSIFSFGQSFFETFDRLGRDTVAYEQIEPYIEAHERSGLFNKYWRREDLVAVLALQGYISSKQVAEGDRGQGTVDFIRFFQTVWKDCVATGPRPVMSVLTGRTLIRFDGTYEMVPSGSQKRMTIAFNDANNLLERPDPDAVKALDEGFPGVVISISFQMTNAVLEEVDGTDNEN